MNSAAGHDSDPRPRPRFRIRLQRPSTPASTPSRPRGHWPTWGTDSPVIGVEIRQLQGDGWRAEPPVDASLHLGRCGHAPVVSGTFGPRVRRSRPTAVSRPGSGQDKHSRCERRRPLASGSSIGRRPAGLTTQFSARETGRNGAGGEKEQNVAEAPARGHIMRGQSINGTTGADRPASVQEI